MLQTQTTAERVAFKAADRLHEVLQVGGALGVNNQLLLAELRQTRADVNGGPHQLILHSTMRAWWHDCFTGELVDCATFWAAFPNRLPMADQRALKPLLSSEDKRDMLMAVIQRNRSVCICQGHCHTVQPWYAARPCCIVSAIVTHTLDRRKFLHFIVEQLMD